MEAAEVCLGGSTVPAAVIIVVKHRVCLSVSQLIVGIQAQLFIYLGCRHISIRAYINAKAVYTGIKE